VLCRASKTLQKGLPRSRLQYDLGINPTKLLLGDSLSKGQSVLRLTEIRLKEFGQERYFHARGGCLQNLELCFSRTFHGEISVRQIQRFFLIGLRLDYYVVSFPDGSIH
jgi:hypothetical protein